LSEAGTVIANDRDSQSLDMARANTAQYWIESNFSMGRFQN